MKANFNSSFERDFYSNIKKVYWFKFFRSFHLFSAVLVPFFTVWGKISFSEIMILQAIFTFSIFLLEIPTGVIADRLGRRLSLIVSGLFGVVAPLVYVSYPSFWVFALAEVLWAAGAALSSGADSALIYDSLKSAGRDKESKKIFARVGSFGLAGIFVAAPLGGLVAEMWNVQATMILTTLPMIVAVLISLGFKEPSHFDEKEINNEKVGYWVSVKDGVSYLRGHKVLRIMMIDYILIGILAFFLIWVYQVVLTSNEISVGWFGFVHMGIVAGQVLVLNNIERLERFVGGKKKYFDYSAVLVGVLFLVLAFTSNVVALVGSIFLIGAFGMTRKNLYSSYFNKFIESHNRATVLSVISMGYSLARSVSNVVLGLVVDLDLRLGLVLVGTLILIVVVFSKLEEEHLLD